MIRNVKEINYSFGQYQYGLSKASNTREYDHFSIVDIQRAGYIVNIEAQYFDRIS